MATPTYTPIESKTLGSSASSVTFTSIPSTYTDLVLIVNGGTSSGSNALYMRFNNDSTSIYSTTYMYGNGSSTAPGRLTTRDAAAIGYYVEPGTGNEFNSIVHIQNYANTNVYKTVLDRANSTAGTYPGAEASVSLWRSTAAINRIDVLISSNTINAGTTFTLYGIANAAIGAPKATGGTITYDNTYYYHTFGASGTFTPQQSLTADILVVAGGGGGGGAGSSGTDGAGGGGAGGLLGFASQSLTATGYTVTVGSGGAGVTNSSSRGATGGDSQFGALTLVKGGGGGGSDGTTTGATGGSGGGAGYNGTGGSPTSGQGNSGGTTSNNTPGGGGGAGAAGSAGATASDGGNGGVGVSTYSSYGLVTGTGENVSGTVYYAGGGGGASDASAGVAGTGGFGGGGLGMYRGSSPAASGLVNTGGGGGGAGAGNKTSGNGGSGVVIVRYLKA